jgi:formylglycine-generating enzyme required for sulfatase activity
MRLATLALLLAATTAFGQPPAAPKAARPAAAPPPANGAFRDCAGCPEMIVVPPGTFLLGTSADEPEVDRDRGEAPPLPVTMNRAFAIGRYEVKVAEWRAFVEATQYPLRGDCRVETSAPGCGSPTATGVTPVSGARRPTTSRSCASRGTTPRPTPTG